MVATTTETNERVVLRSYFTVVPEKTTSTDRDMCAVTIINNGSEVKNGTVNVEFTGTEAVTSFQCRMDRKRNVPCKEERENLIDHNYAKKLLAKNNTPKNSEILYL